MVRTMEKSAANMIRRWFGWTLLSMVAVAGCNPSGPMQDPVAVAPTPERSALSEADQSSLLAALAEAEVCLREGFLDVSCPALAQLGEHPRVADGSAEPFLIERVGEGTEAQIWLAAHLLRSAAQRYRRDPELAAELLGNAEAATSDELRYACDLGGAAGRIVASETGLAERMEALLRSHPNACVRQAAMAEIVAHDAERFLPIVIEIATSGSADDRLFAVQALTQPGVLPEVEACKLLSEVAEQHDAALEASEVAATRLLGCDTYREATVDLIEQWAKAGNVHYYGTGNALLTRHRAQDVTEAERERLRAVAKAILDHEGNNIVSRETALKFLFEADPNRHAIAKAVGTGPRTRMWAIANSLRGYDYPHTVFARALDSFGSAASQPVARQVEDGAWERESELRSCYDEALEATPDFARVFTLAYEYDENGKLMKLDGMPEDLPAGFGECVDAVVRGMSVSVPAAGDVRVGSLELTFELRDI